MLNHAHITNITTSHESPRAMPPTVTIEPGEPVTSIGKRVMGEYVRNKVTVRGADDSCTITYVMVPLWEREI